ncbi:dienelactone hydrolase endo-1-3,1,4-beta-D-glucanase [Auriscalpium vulgare]|uniref:Dienelactone hydrolase endo-1-3,1,4-beta-D-glucanase n=1 Tax=Auriscalpium vulgare TaxID=40419 RepID=A0ACB8RJJ5_9AGAM|nr:dienelactone hydrolase endo-1-3,1,4-beta-D-glucanase [Auriscalpium vulgare]
MSCENCYKGHLLPGQPRGQLVDGAYFSPAVATNTLQSAAPKKAVVLLTDIFGLSIPNPRLMADAFAERLGVDVWVPDVFNGTPLRRPPVSANSLEPLMADRAGVKRTWWQTFRLVSTLLPAAPAFYSNRPAVCDARLEAFLERLRTEKAYDRIGAVGYCWGGSMAVRAAAKSLFNTLVICHPGALGEHQIRGIQVPVSWALAEDDDGFPEKNRALAESVLAQRRGSDAVEYEFKVYKGTAHGFAARPNLKVPDVKAGFEGARDQAVAWFEKTL